MTSSTLRRGTGIAAAVAIVAAAVAVGLTTLGTGNPSPRAASSPNAPAQTSAPEVTSTSSPTPTPSASPTSAPVSYPAGWKRYSSKELGLSFMFPTPGSTTNYELLLPGKRTRHGYGFEWWAERGETYDADLGRGWTYAFAAVHTTDFAVGRHTWITDLDRWYWDGSTTMIVWSEDTDPVAVSALRTVKTAAGLDGLIFDPRQTKGTREAMNDHPGGRVAMLNLPKSYDANVRGITFYFYEKTSVDDIERALESVELSPDGPSYR